MKTTPTISDAEWQVMEVLWRQAPKTAAEVATELEARTQWSAKTVRTLLGRLVKKGALTASPDPSATRTFLYSPAVAEAACKREEARSFIQRIFGGSVAPMVAQLAEAGDLAEEDFEALRSLLDAHDGEASS